MRKVRRPIDELMAKARSGLGLKCPNCGCVQFADVRHTRPVEGAIRRYRTCRNCEHTWVTVER